MALTPGTCLGPYEITGQIGVGGMGEVYRATDTNLKRSVAIKVLPASVAADAERLARFQREAQVLAALNHPNIAQIHGLEKTGGTSALVLELVEGPTLADRIAQGAIPLDEALHIARQIGEALEAAHQQGIMHRDLKPANIKVRGDGTVKVLDFGLAKAVEGPADASPSASPTITTPAMTQSGMILGTAAYMSPEQARGKTVDKRTDIWAFGAVLYEMLVGKRAFDGEDVTMTLARVVEREPDFEALPTSVPARVRQSLRVCLQKNPKQRAHDMADIRLALEGAFETIVPPGARGIASLPSEWRRSLVPFSALVIGGVVVGGAVWFATRVAPARVVHTEIATAGATVLSILGADRDIAITPDGSRIVYRGQNQLVVRALDQLTPTALTGLGAPRGPFVSPDGQWVGFFDGNSLKKVSIAGGPVSTLATLDGSATGSRGASWGEDGTIIVATNSTDTGLQRGSAAGGEVTVLTKPNRQAGEGDHVWPELLPGGQSVLFTITPVGGNLDNAQIAVLDLRTNTQKVIVQGGNHAYYVASGHLVYGARGKLRAVAFDLARLAVTGTSVPVVDQVAITGAGGVNAVVAGNATLVYVPGGMTSTQRSLVWVDRQGREEPIRLPPADYNWAHLSPDGSRVAVSLTGPEGQDVWVSDLGRGSLSRITTDPATDNDPIWTMDGRRVVFPSRRNNGRYGFYSMAADGTGPVDLLAMSETVGFFRPYSWSPDGKTLVFDYAGSDGNGNIGMLSMEGARPWKPLLQTEANEISPALSPDGAWIAYTSNRTGRPEVYMERFPGLTDRQPISTDGGAEPLWSRDGQELFYRSGNAMMVVPLDRSSMSVGSPEVLFEGSYYATDGSRRYDIAPDGKRFLMLRQGGNDDASPPQNLAVVLNWLEELKRLVPTK